MGAVLALMAKAEKLVDYTHSNYIPIMDGDAVMWEQFGYLTHFTNFNWSDSVKNETRVLIRYYTTLHYI